MYVSLFYFCEYHNVYNLQICLCISNKRCRVLLLNNFVYSRAVQHFDNKNDLVIFLPPPPYHPHTSLPTPIRIRIRYKCIDNVLSCMFLVLTTYVSCVNALTICVCILVILKLFSHEEFLVICT